MARANKIKYFLTAIFLIIVALEMDTGTLSSFFFSILVGWPLTLVLSLTSIFFVEIVCVRKSDFKLLLYFYDFGSSWWHAFSNGNRSRSCVF